MGIEDSRGDEIGQFFLPDPPIKRLQLQGELFSLACLDLDRRGNRTIEAASQRQPIDPVRQHSTGCDGKEWPSADSLVHGWPTSGLSPTFWDASSTGEPGKSREASPMGTRAKRLG